MKNPAHQHPFTLATDLDGTFLGGSDDQRTQLYNFIANHRSVVTLVFVTGRGVESLLSLLADPLTPKPDYIIADIGATVINGQDMAPVQPLQANIEKQWPGTSRVMAKLEPFSFLERQQVPQERRCSFSIRPEDITTELKTAVEELGCQSIYSCDQYFDVLPTGVDKGETLLKLAKAENLDREHIIVAGDTMNDLSLFEAPGIKGIVVGQAENKLIEAVKDKDNVFLADQPGAGGIIQGLIKFGLLDPFLLKMNAEPKAKTAPSRQLIIAYHRPPFQEHQTKDGRTVLSPHKSPNGVVPTILGMFANRHHGYWVSWSKQPERQPDGFKELMEIDPHQYPGLTANRIALTEDDVRRFYEEFSKEAFWPVIFSFPSKAEFREEQWRHFCEINRLFAERVARDAEPDAFVWVHDYNLWMLPSYLRRLRPDVFISFFHYTAFPPSDIFNVVPWSRELAASLVQCDEVGFHIPRYAENFVEVISSHMPVDILDEQPCAPKFMTYGCALGVSKMAGKIRAMDRELTITARPVGINYQLIEQILNTDQSRRSMAETRSGIGDRKLILSVERLDYVKGPLEKLSAFESLLEEHPQLHGQLTFFNIITPAAQGMSVYDQIREEVDQMTGRINGRFSDLDWTPVRYFFRSFPFDEILPLYAAADIAFITPLRDGLNLVAKEFVAAKAITESSGVLVLSEFCGAAVELHGALLTNPYHAKSMSDSLYMALSMDEDEKRERLRRLAGIVKGNDIKDWTAAFLKGE